MDRLLKICRDLRDPAKGCPWDKAQTFETFAENVTGEAREVVAALQAGDFPHLREELGDLLFNLCFLINLAEEQGRFTREEVITGIAEKMVRRHPHVYGDAVAHTAEEAAALFYQAKAGEKRDRPRNP